MIHFRNAISEDLPSIVAIYNSTIKLNYVTADQQPWTIQGQESWLLNRNMNTRPVWIAEKNGSIVGWASLKDFYGRPAYSITAEVSVYIAEEHRGEGLGKNFIDYIQSQAHQLGLENLLAFIFEENAGSLQLFKSKGFEEWGRLPETAKHPTGYQTLIILGWKTRG